MSRRVREGEGAVKDGKGRKETVNEVRVLLRSMRADGMIRVHPLPSAQIRGILVSATRTA